MTLHCTELCAGRERHRSLAQAHDHSWDQQVLQAQGKSEMEKFYGREGRLQEVGLAREPRVHQGWVSTQVCMSSWVRAPGQGVGQSGI